MTMMSKHRVSMWGIVVGLLAISAIPLTLALMNPAGRDALPIVLGLVLAAVFVLPVGARERRRRMRVLESISQGRPPQVAFLAATAPGTFMPDSELNRGGNFPLDTAASSIGVTVRGDDLQLWSGYPRCDLVLTLPPDSPNGVKVEEDDAHGPRIIWLRWDTPDGRWNLGLIPLNIAGLVRRPASQTDYARYVEAITAAATTRRA